MAELGVELLVLCETVSADDAGRCILDRTIGHLVKDEFPAEQSMSLYAEVWGAPHGNLRVHARIDGPRGDVLAEHAPDGVGLDEEGVALFAIPFDAVPLRDAGVHTAVLLADGQVMAQRRFRVSLAPARTLRTGTL